jgi:hypothetical protein
MEHEGHPPSDPRDRLARAAARLKADQPPVPETGAAAQSDDRLSEVLAGLEQAEVGVRRARERLADVEARLGWGIRVRRT